MAEIIGHWNTLAEASKLTQSTLLSGVVETVIEGGGPMSMLPVVQLNGPSLDWRQELSWEPMDAIDDVGVGDQLTWRSDVGYKNKTSALKIAYRQDRLDNFIKSTYRNINDYKTQMIQEITKRYGRAMNYRFFYGDPNDDSNRMSGAHRLAVDELTSGTAGTGQTLKHLNIDNAEAHLSLRTLPPATRSHAHPGARHSQHLHLHAQAPGYPLRRCLPRGRLFSPRPCHDP